MRIDTKQPFILLSNKENRKVNRQIEKSHRHRNDHSIQAKSPIKIPQSSLGLSLKKDDLTFRNKTQQCSANNHFSQQNSQPFINKKLHTQPSNNQLCKTNALSQYSMKININSILCKNQYQNMNNCIEEKQGKLINQLLKIISQLSVTNNQLIKQSITKIQSQAKKILIIMAEENYHNEAPLASSKKIKLQNCIAHSHCQNNKQSDQKQIESDYQSSNSHVLASNSIISQRIQNSQNHSYQVKSTPKQSQNQELERKKIMYMLDGRQMKSENKNIGHKKNSNGANMSGIASERISSLSSFNQNQCDDSGYTVFEIQKCSVSQRMSQSSNYFSSNEKIDNKYQNSQQRVYQADINMTKKQSKRSSQGQICYQNSLCMSVGNKRKILNDIVTMLNQKYNKNIKLQ